jgi:cell fate (sporulation/competence/biofilm development) regulator YlbF (YheA/YmcA/DUF963 family)
MLIIDEKLLEIEDLLDELVGELLNLPEIAVYRQAKMDFLSDELLQEKLLLLNENLDYVAYRPELKALQREINTNEKVYAVRLAENDLQMILSELTKNITRGISEHIYVDENLPLKGGHHGHHG